MTPPLGTPRPSRLDVLQVVHFGAVVPIVPGRYVNHLDPFVLLLLLYLGVNNIPDCRRFGSSKDGRLFGPGQDLPHPAGWISTAQRAARLDTASHPATRIFRWPRRLPYLRVPSPRHSLRTVRSSTRRQLFGLCNAKPAMSRTRLQKSGRDESSVWRVDDRRIKPASPPDPSGPPPPQSPPASCCSCACPPRGPVGPRETPCARPRPRTPR